MAHLKLGLLAVVAGVMLSGCVDSMSIARMQSYHPVNVTSPDDIQIVYSNGTDYRTPIKPWFYGY